MEISSDRACANARTKRDREDFPVSGVPGFSLRVSKDGRKVWTLRYRTGSRSQRRVRIGEYPAMSLHEARKRARTALNIIADGEDPAADRAALRRGKKFSDLWDYWYERHAKRKLDSAEQEKTRYAQHILPHLGSLPMADLRRQDVASMRDYVFDHSGPVQSNRCLALVNRVLNFALEEDLIEANPAARMRKAGKEKPRERVLSDDEIAKLWRALADAENWTAAAGSGARGRPLSLSIVRAIRVLLLTGQRRAEVIEVPIGELALNDRQPMWTIASERVKNDVPHRVPLAALAAYEFRRALADANAGVPANSTGALAVFPSPDNCREPVGPAAVTKAMHRLCKRIGIERAGPHDLRRTVGTGLAKLGVPPDIRSLVLNHTRGRSTSETTRVYDRHGYDNEKLEALGKWEDHVRSIVAGASGANVALSHG